MGFGAHKAVTGTHGAKGGYIDLKAIGSSEKVVLFKDCVWGPAFYNGRGYDATDEWEGKNIGLRFACSAYVVKDKEVKVLEGPQSLYTALGTLFDDPDADPYNCIVKVERSGQQKFEAKIIKPLSDAQQEVIAAEDELDLSERASWLKGVNLKKLRAYNKKVEGVTETEDVPSEKAPATDDDDDIAF